MAIRWPNHIQKRFPQIWTEYAVCSKQSQFKHRTNAKSIHR